MSNVAAWPSQAGNWLDERGKGAWIAAMIIGFIIYWPVGLGLLAYMIWSNRLFDGRCARRKHTHRHTFGSSGNTAFDTYKADTLRRLEEEQKQFEKFLQRLRDAKDKSELDQFMDERAARTRRERERADENPDENPVDVKV